MSRLLFLLVLCLPVTAQATPVTITLADSFCLWCTGGSLTLEQTDQGFVFGNVQSASTAYQGLFSNPDYVNLDIYTRISPPMDYACLTCGPSTTWTIEGQHDFLTTTLWATVETVNPTTYLLSLSEWRQISRDDLPQDTDLGPLGDVWDRQRAYLTGSVAVPEPSTWLLLASGLGMMWWGRRSYR